MKQSFEDPYTTKEVEFIVEKLPSRKFLVLVSLTGEFYHMFKEELILVV